ncbi:ATP-binding protein [Streptomyces sp. N50]|uniref:ATP-binding protein n=1 Tax=Streptomyces sp. N50 TaxID=3081765 RepID=UPI00296223DE|nr:ATP-binding protein [Streptomyces sp. N50]WOX11333.1 ATP-binding protein [Streptomyces sp. N50]
MTVTTTPTAVNPPGLSRSLPSVPESARAARHLVSLTLRGWDLDELIEAATLIVSELVANSIDHTPCRLLRVVLSRPSPGMVRLGVADRSRVLPELGTPAADAEQGRGLVLIEALSWRWGADRHDQGKLVWAELRVEQPS